MHRLALFAPLAVVFGCAGSASDVVHVVDGLDPDDREHEASSQSELVERSLPAVVLLLTMRTDGSIGYGSGLILDHEGVVLTALHVVEGGKVRAMLYKKERTSYTPMDGGLGRYMFENQRDIVDGTVIARDATADLALVKLSVLTPNAPVLPFAKGKIAPGERVLALGHPQETVWSFTSGVVGALHNGAIQHDATVSQGSSGGPLLNEQGEVVGINTSKVVNEARGLSFARPIDMASRLLASKGDPEIELDRSTPDKAIVACWHAHELASPAMVECLDWDASYRAFEGALADLKRRGLRAEAERFGAAVEKAGGRDAWIDGRRQAFAQRQRDASSSTSAFDAPPSAGSDVVRTLGELRASSDRQREARLTKNGIKVDLADPKAMHDLLRMGLRVEEVREVTPGIAWARLSGRNPDGSVYSYSECWAKVEEGWVERTPPLPDDAARLPKGWPAPVDDFEHAVERAEAWLLVKGLTLAMPGSPGRGRSRTGKANTVR